MTSLLALPREIRNQIISYLTRPHCANPSDLGHTFEELVQDWRVLYTPILNSQNRSVLYDPKGTVANTTNLLLVNHQFCTEDLENCSLLNLDKVTYRLDITILDEIVPYDELDNGYYSMWACLCALIRQTGTFDQSNWFSFRKVLFEHVGVIELDLPTSRGERKTGVDVAELLRDVTVGDRGGLVGLEEGAEYKEIAWAKRRARGLKVLED